MSSSSILVANSALFLFPPRPLAKVISEGRNRKSVACRKFKIRVHLARGKIRNEELTPEQEEIKPPAALNVERS